MATYDRQYNITVDTNPMAQEIEKVSSNVGGVRNAVVAMQTAVIIAENKAADHVCENINKGFFTLVRSQISQKIAVKKSEADSIIIELQMQAKSLLSIKKRMESDFYMIAKRYNDLFNSLNKALHNRIFEIDKPTITFVEKELKLSSNRINRMIATVPVNQSESLSISQKLAASHTRQNGLKTISAMKSFISEVDRQRVRSSSILLNKVVTTDEILYFPVLLAIQEDETTQSEMINIHFPQTRYTPLTTQMMPMVKGKIYQALPTLHWNKVQAENKEKTAGYYNTLLSQSSLSTRVKEVMMQLYKLNDWQTLNKY